MLFQKDKQMALFGGSTLVVLILWVFLFTSIGEAMEYRVCMTEIERQMSNLEFLRLMQWRGV